MNRKYRRSLIVGGCLLCLLTGCAGNQNSNYEQGALDLENKEYESAIENFELAVAEKEHTAEALRGEGIAYLRFGNYEEAEKAFSSALKKAEKSKTEVKTDILSYLSSVEYKLADYESSLKHAEALMDLKESKEAHFLKGSAELHLDQYDDAKEDFSKVIEKSEDYDDYLQVYKVYADYDLKADGASYLEQALEIDGTGKEDAYNKGRIYYYLEEYDKAKEELSSSYEDGYKDAAIYLGKVYAELGDIDNAKSMYQECLNEKGYQAKAYNGLAYCNILEEDYASALKNIQKGLDAGDEEEKQGLLFNEILGRLAFLPAVTGFFCGILFLLFLDGHVPHLHIGCDEPEGPSCTLKKNTMLVLAVTLHNIPEGMAVGVMFAGLLTANSGITLAGAFALSVGIAIQNFPEGAIISLPLKGEGMSSNRAFLYGTLSGVVEPVAALLTVLLYRVLAPVLPYLLAFAAGAMMYVVVEELIPETAEGEHSNIGTIGFAVGFALMMMLDVALG